ncbi:hypothetical protein NKG94_23850 [Micromonospora sp. M12]
MTAAFASLQYVRGGFSMDTLFSQIDLYKALVAAKDTAGRRLYPALGPSNASGTASARYAAIDVNGVRALPAWALAATGSVVASSYLFDREVVHGWATARSVWSSSTGLRTSTWRSGATRPPPSRTSTASARSRTTRCRDPTRTDPIEQGDADAADRTTGRRVAEHPDAHTDDPEDRRRPGAGAGGGSRHAARAAGRRRQPVPAAKVTEPKFTFSEGQRDELERTGRTISPFTGALFVGSGVDDARKVEADEFAKAKPVKPTEK